MSVEDYISKGKIIMVGVSTSLLLLSNAFHSYYKNNTVNPNNDDIIFSDTIRIDEIIYNDIGIPFDTGNECIVHIIKDHNGYKIIMRSIQ